MKVEMLLEKVEWLVRNYPNLEINEIKFDNIEVVIDLDVDSFRRILKAIPSGSCAGIVTSDGKIKLKNRWRFDDIGDVLFRTSL